MGSDVAFIGSITFPESSSLVEAPALEPRTSRALIARDHPDAACQWAHTTFDPRTGTLSFEGHVERTLYQSDVRPELVAILGEAARAGAEGELVEVGLEGFGARISLKDGHVERETLPDDTSWTLWQSERFLPVRIRCERAADEALAALGLTDASPRAR